MFNGGRTAVRIITGGDDRELRADGSHIGKDERYARTDEYLSVVRQEWTSEQPFDLAGTYYQVEGAHSTVKSPQQPHIPLYFRRVFRGRHCRRPANVRRVCAVG